MSTAITRLDALPPGFSQLRDTALAEGWKMLQVLEEDWRSGAMRFDAPGEALFAAWQDGALAGIGGLTVDPYAEDASTGRVRRLYVDSAHRGRGLGRALVEAIVEAARGHGFHSVRVRAPAAAGRFYVACGFLPAVLRSATHVRPL